MENDTRNLKNKSIGSAALLADTNRSGKECFKLVLRFVILKNGRVIFSQHIDPSIET